MAHELVAISLFVCVTYGFTYLVKALLDARARSLLTREGASDPDALRALLAAEERQRRFGLLRWGVGLVATAAGFALIEAFGWRDVTPGAIAVLAGALGLGQITLYFLSR